MIQVRGDYNAIFMYSLVSVLIGKELMSWTGG